MLRSLVAIVNCLAVTASLGYVSVNCDLAREAERCENVRTQLRAAHLDNVSVFISFPQRADVSRNLFAKYRVGAASPRVNLITINYLVQLQKALDSNENNFLLLESDVIFDKGFEESLRAVMIEAARTPFDMISIGSCLNMHAKRTSPSQLLYRESTTRCTDSIVWSRRGVEKFLEYYRNDQRLVVLPIDHYLNAFLKDSQNVVQLWAEPSLTAQGSMTGRFKSSALDA